MNEILKNRIKKSFNKSWKTYDSNCLVQNKACSKLIDLLEQHDHSYKVIADFACGTGVSTQQLINQYNYNKIYAIDFSDKLLGIAKHTLRTTNIEFILSDFDTLLFSNGHIDLLFCNMGLQWSLNLQGTLKLFSSYLSESGIMAFSMPIYGMFPEIKQSFKNIFYKPADIKAMIKYCKLKLIDAEQVIHTIFFRTPLYAIRSIKSVGANCTLHEYNRTAVLTKREFKNIFVDPANPSLTYKIGLFIVKKQRR